MNQSPESWARHFMCKLPVAIVWQSCGNREAIARQSCGTRVALGCRHLMVWVELEDGVIFQKKHEKSKSTQTVEGHNPATFLSNAPLHPFHLILEVLSYSDHTRKNRWGATCRTSMLNEGVRGDLLWGVAGFCPSTVWFFDSSRLDLFPLSANAGVGWW